MSLRVVRRRRRRPEPLVKVRILPPRLPKLHRLRRRETPEPLVKVRILPPQLPGFPKEDLAICRAVREAAGDDMVLMHDPFGVYTLDEAIWMGHELEKLGYYWLEHPIIETRVEAYRRLCRELSIAILAPEHVPGGPFARAEWAHLHNINDGTAPTAGIRQMTGRLRAHAPASGGLAGACHTGAGDSMQVCRRVPRPPKSGPGHELAAPSAAARE